MPVRILRLSVAFLLALATATSADIRAVYKNTYGFEQIIEISNSGAVRIGRGHDLYSDYVLYLDEQVFSVTAGPGGPIVLTMGAAVALAEHQRAQIIEFGGGTDEEVETPLVYRPSGKVVIAGVAGVRYDLEGTDYPDFTRVVLADSPDLRPLGRAFLLQRNWQDKLAGGPDNSPDPLQPLLESHGVLASYDLELTSVSFDPIDPSRFSLPKEAITEPTIRMQLPAQQVVEDVVESAHVISAAYYKGRLYTGLTDGRMQVWSEGALRGQDIAVPGKVEAFCVLGADLFALTTPAQGLILYAGKLTLWKADGAGEWASVAKIDMLRGQHFQALDCTGPSPGVLLEGAFHLPMEGKVIRLLGKGPDNGPFLVTLRHGGHLYVGSNMGEWGGGLWRYTLEGEALGSAGSQGRCGFTGDECSNITGLVPDPRDPACVLVASGLIHFISSGKMLRLCGNALSLAYAKPMTVQPDWTFDGTLPADAWSQVAFQSLARNGNGVWAVGTDGVYHFEQAASPGFRAFEPFGGFSASGVDWSHPEYVLVASSASRRHAVNNGSLLLVLREN